MADYTITPRDLDKFKVDPDTAYANLSPVDKAEIDSICDGIIALHEKIRQPYDPKLTRRDVRVYLCRSGLQSVPEAKRTYELA